MLFFLLVYGMYKLTVYRPGVHNEFHLLLTREVVSAEEDLHTATCLCYHDTFVRYQISRVHPTHQIQHAVN